MYYLIGKECQDADRRSKDLLPTFLVSMRLGETPVLIPNTMVKTYAADGTALETKWESRWRPGSMGV